MRILHVLDHSIPLHSGYAFRTLAILREQRALRWETLQLTSPKHGGSEALTEDVEGWRFHRTTADRSVLASVPGLRELRLMSATERRIESIAREHRPDVIHAHSPVLNAIPALRVGRRLGIPVVYEVRAFWEDAAVDHGTAREGGLRYRVSRALETRALHRADAVTTICEGLRAEIVARGVDARKVTVIANAVDIAAFSDGQEADETLKARLGLVDCRVLGFIGSFYAYEGLALLLRALPKILAVEPRVRLLLVGGGPQDQELRGLAAELGLKQSVVFAGRVPHTEVRRYYDLVDVLVYPRLPMRLTEIVTPLKPLEAMAQGKALVASDVGGHRELIRDQETGVLFRAGDDGALAKAVLGILSDPQRLDAMRTAARRFVETERSWAQSVGRYRMVYERLLADKRIGAPSREGPRVVVFTTLFPHPGQPGAGLFIRERMFRVAKHLPLTVVAPVPWFPFQGVLRRWKPHFRPQAPAFEVQGEIEVRHPRFLSVPGVFKWLDGVFMALGCFPTMLRLKRSFGFNLIDAHFAYPDGDAATLLGRWMCVPVTITLRGTEVPLARDPRRHRRMIKALERAARVFSVSDSLKRHAVQLGIAGEKILVVANGVDTQKFRRLERGGARERLEVPRDTPLLISVGALVERKGIHRVIECLPDLRRRFPGLCYLIAGGASPEGDLSAQLRRLVSELELEGCVRFLGAVAPDDLKVALSAADIFVLATRNEGWANVFLEAMACGLPVVTTDVGGNAEVVCNPELGIVVPFGDRAALTSALEQALTKEWDHDAIIEYARANSWDGRVVVLLEEMQRLALVAPAAPAPLSAGEGSA